MQVPHTDQPLDPPRVQSRVPFSLPIFPLRPLLLLRPPQLAALANDHPPKPRSSFCTGILLPPHVSSPCILILPIIPTSSFGNPSLPKERWIKREEDKEEKAFYRLGFLSSSAFNWHSPAARRERRRKATAGGERVVAFARVADTWQRTFTLIPQDFATSVTLLTIANNPNSLRESSLSKPPLLPNRK